MGWVVLLLKKDAFEDCVVCGKLHRPNNETELMSSAPETSNTFRSHALYETHPNLFGGSRQDRSMTHVTFDYSIIYFSLVFQICHLLKHTRDPHKIKMSGQPLRGYPVLIAPFGDAYEKIGTIQRRLAWPLHKDDTLFQSGRPTGLNIYFSRSSGANTSLKAAI